MSFEMKLLPQYNIGCTYKSATEQFITAHVYLLRQLNIVEVTLCPGTANAIY